MKKWTDAARAWLKARGWSVTFDHDFRPTRRYGVLSVVKAQGYWCRGDYIGAHVAVLGLHLSVTKHKRGRA
jgi:hypothetical protein